MTLACGTIIYTLTYADWTILLYNASRACAPEQLTQRVFYEANEVYTWQCNYNILILIESYFKCTAHFKPLSLLLVHILLIYFIYTYKIIHLLVSVFIKLAIQSLGSEMR